MSSTDPFNLTRFVDAQASVYDSVLAELRSGRKRSHWMWFIFPQVTGLAMSETSRFYAIRSLDEAGAYLKHPVLGPRLIECAQAVLSIEDRSASQIFGYPDDLKLRSSMTLFSLVDGADAVFDAVLERFFDGEADKRTMQIVADQRGA